MNRLFDIKSAVKEIELNGKKLALEYDYRAYAMIEELCKKSVYEIKDDILGGKISLTNQVIVLYCGLLRHQENFSLTEIKSLKNLGHFLAKSFPALLEAFFSPLLPPKED